MLNRVDFGKVFVESFREICCLTLVGLQSRFGDKSTTQIVAALCSLKGQVTHSRITTLRPKGDCSQYKKVTIISVAEKSERREKASPVMPQNQRPNQSAFYFLRYSTTHIYASIYFEGYLDNNSYRSAVPFGGHYYGGA